MLNKEFNYVSLLSFTLNVRYSACEMGISFEFRLSIEFFNRVAMSSFNLSKAQGCCVREECRRGCNYSISMLGLPLPVSRAPFPSHSSAPEKTLLYSVFHKTGSLSVTANHHQDSVFMSCSRQFIDEGEIISNYLFMEWWERPAASGSRACYTRTDHLFHPWVTVDKWVLLLGSFLLRPWWNQWLVLSKTTHAQNPCALRTTFVLSLGFGIQQLWIITSDMLLKRVWRPWFLLSINN